MKDLLRYDKMVESALRGVVREALARTAANGLPGAHHFYLTFKTHFPGLNISEGLVAQYPEEMTVVLEHQFWDLEVHEDHFAVTLSFQGKPERLVVPFEAVTNFSDPSVKFGLQFQAGDGMVPPAAPEPAPKTEDKKKPDTGKSAKTGEVVALDSFRKK